MLLGSNALSLIRMSESSEESVWQFPVTQARMGPWGSRGKVCDEKEATILFTVSKVVNVLFDHMITARRTSFNWIISCSSCINITMQQAWPVHCSMVTAVFKAQANPYTRSTLLP